MSLEIFTWNVGIDVSKADFRVNLCVEGEGRKIKSKGSRKFGNTPGGREEFVKWANKKSGNARVKFTMEATGVYHESLAYYLHSLGYYVTVLLPNKAKAFGKSLNIKTKTDKVDAKMLGVMGLERRTEAWEPMSEQMYHLKKISRERAKLVKTKTAITCRKHAEKSSHEPNSRVLQRSDTLIAQINVLIQETEQEMRDTLKKDSELHEKVKNICAIKGIDIVTAVSVIAETDGFALFKNEAQLTSYAGYDVVQKQSGSSIRGKTRISKKGNKYIRGALYMPAVTAIRCNSEMKAFCDKIERKTGIYKKGNVAVQRKLLLLIYTLFKSGEKYDPLYNKKRQDKLQGIEKKICKQDNNPAYSGCLAPKNNELLLLPQN